MTDKTETCEACGKPCEFTISMQVPGQPLSKAICMKCLRDLPKRIRADEKRRRKGSKR